jgi:uncharacterized protein (TIGR00251 family)
MIPIREHSEGATFAVRVHPRAQRTAITGTIGEALKISLAAPAFEGRANAELTEFLSGLFDLPRSAIRILSGANTRNKVVRVSGHTASELRLALQKHFTV